MIHAILHYFEYGSGYQFWSGAGSDLAEFLWPMALIIGLYRHHNCHAPGCRKLGHRHPQHGWPACRDHWADVPAHAQGAVNESE